MNHMVPFVDTEAPTQGRLGETPLPRFGSEHIVRDEIPAVRPDILDFMDRQEQNEAAFLATLAEKRRAEIALADTVTLRLEAFSA